jgi:predicted nuclease of predicted toxin-antitoxin system
MKLLLDENLSFRLQGLLADIYPDALHVREAGLLGAKDQQIWAYAKERNFLIVSKDTDFYERSILYGAPPKIIWLRIGNCTVNDTAALLRNQYIMVRNFAEDETAAFLPLFNSKIETIVRRQ